MPPTIGTEDFNVAYQKKALIGPIDATPEQRKPAAPGTLAALIVSYKQSADYARLRSTTKKGYTSRALRIEHGQRAVAGLSRERIINGILQLYRDRPGAELSILKMLRILISHAIAIGWLKQDPSVGIERPKTKEVRSWTDDELVRYEARWPIGDKATRSVCDYALRGYRTSRRASHHVGSI